jgi:hypothetical protein
MMDDLGRRLTAPELFIREFPPAAILAGHNGWFRFCPNGRRPDEPGKGKR